MIVDMGYLRQWIGTSEERHDRIAAFPANALAATLDRDDPPFVDGMALPPMWHLIYCNPTTRASGLGRDGHAARGGFLPPVPLPRRMWAGGRLTFHRPLRIGEPVRRTARVQAVEEKRGRSGPLVFVNARLDFAGAEGLAVTEERDIVYREQQAADVPPKMAATQAEWERVVTPDPVLLFRYSALTFNGHRIHYDPGFAIDDEGYPGIIVHGPLIATLLVDLLRRELPMAELRTFTFRAVMPLFAPHPFRVCGSPAAGGKTVHLWASDDAGRLAMEATAKLA